MTSLTKNVKRLAFDARRGALVVTLTPAGVEFRYPRGRKVYGPVPFGLIMLQGEKMAAVQLHKDRAAKKAARTLSRRTR